MAKLTIDTQLNRVVVVGEFCKWNLDEALSVERKKDAKFITINEMPVGEYRVLDSKSYLGGEVYPTDGRQMSNRYFSGNVNETISCFFN